MKKRKFLSMLLAAAMVVTTLPATAWADVTYPEPVAAKLEDRATSNKQTTLYDSGTYKVERNSDSNITISVEGLKEHENANHVKGYWVGIALEAPTGATHFKYATNLDHIRYAGCKNLLHHGWHNGWHNA